MGGKIEIYRDVRFFHGAIQLCNFLIRTYWLILVHTVFMYHLRSSCDGYSLVIIVCFDEQIALKCADICNPCRPWYLSRRWGELVCDEFFQQGSITV